MGPFLAIVLVAMGLGPGCGGKFELGSGNAPDARLTADIMTWPCTGNGEDSNNDGVYEGVYGFTIALEFAPDGLANRDLPAEGTCLDDLSMFAADAGQSGTEIPGTHGADAAWATSTRSGTLAVESPGFYYDDVLGNQHSCATPAEMVTSGIQVQNAGVVNGLATPGAGEVTWVELEEGDGGGLVFGDDIRVDWESVDWDEIWVQVRQERGGDLWDSVTCNATGDNGFDIDSRVWDKLDSALNVDQINLYVGFQNNERDMTDAGLKLRSSTRVVHVEVLQDE